MTHKVIPLSGEALMPSDPIIEFPYSPDNWQKHAFNSIEQDRDVLINVPTSGGKTTVAIYAILHQTKRVGKKAIYTTPIKSLSNEKYNEFVEIFARFGLTVGILTGDNKINPDADVILATAEILHNSLFQCEKKIQNSKYNLDENFVSSIGCVIMDEIHYMNDLERGKVWEITIIMLQQSVQLVMLSGTIGNREYFCNWICNCRQRDVALIYESKRIVPLFHYIYVDKKMHLYFANDKYISEGFDESEKKHKLIKKEREKNHIFSGEQTDMLSLVHYLKDHDMLQAIVFSFSQKDCEKYADMVKSMDFLDQEEKKKVDAMFRREILSQRNEKGEYKYQNIAEVIKVKDLLDRGIAYHHAGMIQPLRELIEKLMKAGVIKILFATETLCIGVNVPAKTCIFTGIYKYTKKGRRVIYPSEYRQMGGRAGRRGLDDYGNVIFLPLRDFPYKEEFKALILGNNPDIKSNFRLDYQFMLKLAQTDQFNVLDLFQKSLMNAENLDQIKQLEAKKNNFEERYNQIITKTAGTLDLLDQDQQEIIIQFLGLEQKYAETHNIRLSKKQEQELKGLRALIHGTLSMKECYLLLKEEYKLISEIESIDRSITAHKNQIPDKYNSYRKVLEALGYAKESKNEYLRKEDVTVQGLICSQINDCNVILLTELIDQNYFNNLSIEEIVSLLSIFTDPVQKDSMCGPHDFEGTDTLHKKIDMLMGRIGEFEKIERTYVSELDRTEFILCTDYMDIAYEWSSEKTVHVMLEYFKEYSVPVAAFCKNMTRISNILQSTLGIYNMTGKNIEIIPKLEEANRRVMRDIVCTQSLYL